MMTGRDDERKSARSNPKERKKPDKTSQIGKAWGKEAKMSGSARALY